MRKVTQSARIALSVVLCLGLAAAAVSAQAQNQGQAGTRHWVCDPCGLPCDTAVYDSPGTCAKCGMALVDEDEAHRKVEEAARSRKKAAILIFDGVQIIDYTGPYEVFGAAGFQVYTVAATREPVTTAMGMTVVPKFTFADAPQPDVLVVPGGGVREAQGSAATLKWITDTTARTTHTMSVCNGAFILANTGLLDGLTATTTAGQIERLQAAYPKIHVIGTKRYVDNGKIITTAGLSSGIDGALHVVSRMLGNGTAQSVALGEEYDWRPDSGFARAALADRLIPRMDLNAMGQWEVASTQGGTDHWELVLRGSSDRSAAELTNQFSKALSDGKWEKAGSGWKFSGRDGAAWSGQLSVEPVAGQSRQYTARLTIARAG
jgi:putative intracellular protease/amidase